ncbi:hypothetical protein QUH73_14870 [Labilibaculum sp. K2S]|uniref:hypothetical protein n=1 Tax=Labilibaculum sp. K2S TaxID=3056386 RepID=UPI0025A48746|nr:hypothetical protein [Labilibaculum sp. K2S]MDM8161105.1 hypothetical protein [Labilibaculum sp. K2S]
MQNKKFIFITAFLFSVFLMSCQTESLEEAEVTNQSIEKINEDGFLNIPYSDSTTLSKFDDDKEIINYKLARNIAMLEADGTGLLKKMQWEGHVLSKQPVVIYGFDSKPKYYEFFYKDAESKEVGSVTVFARKKAPTVLQEVRGTVRNYDELYAKSDAGMKLIADWTGNMYMGIVGKSGDAPATVIDPETGESVEGMKELSDEEILDEVVNVLKNQAQDFNFSTDTISNLQLRDSITQETTSIQQQADSLKVTMQNEHDQRDAYWEVMEQYTDSFAVLTDDEITNISSKSWFSRTWRKFKNIFNDKTTSEYELAEYKDNYTNEGEYNPVKGYSEWCGPWAMDWIYHVKKGGSKYNHFESWASTMGLVGWTARLAGSKPMFPVEMCVSMRKATSSIWVNPYYSTGRWNALDHIRYKKNPIVILTTSGKSMHWKVAYGCYRTGSVFWRNYYFACQDNGALNIPKNNHYHRSSWFMVFVKVYD